MLCRANTSPFDRFNPRPRMGATLSKIIRAGTSLFQSAPPHGGDMPLSAGTSQVSVFQSAPPHGGDLRSSSTICGGCGFNPRPRMGATGKLAVGSDLTAVSIRAPAWGRRRCAQSRECPDRFNPRPRMGATASIGDSAMMPSFQSAPPHGGDRPTCPRARTPWSFNPRPRMGATWAARIKRTPYAGFNPRPRMGATRRRRRTCGMPKFQSAPPHGGDVEAAPYLVVRKVSIRAPAWGRPEVICKWQLTPEVSIRAPAWGRRFEIKVSRSDLQFQSAPPHGGDLHGKRSCAVPSTFQSAPPHGGDLVGALELQQLPVSIRAPAWGRPVSAASAATR